jgi:class III poly(R)-hydroxyalkanoic acid synthase PhaE subunit
MSGPDSSQAQALPYLKAWDDYAAACQTLFERLSDGSAAHSGAMPLPFLGPWKDFAANLGLRADGQHFKPEDLFGRHLPALGLSREYQEIVRRMLDLGEQFQRRCADFAQAGADIGQSAWTAMQKRSAGDATLLGSPAALYDAWIDCAEEAFARAAHGEPFARLLADLCNLLSAFKLERGKLLEALARHLDLPSRAEVDSLHRQVRVLTAKTNAAATSPAAKSKTTAGAKPKAEAKTNAKTEAQAEPPAGATRPPRTPVRKKRAAK